MTPARALAPDLSPPRPLPPSALPRPSRPRRPTQAAADASGSPCGETPAAEQPAQHHDPAESGWQWEAWAGSTRRRPRVAANQCLSGAPPHLPTNQSSSPSPACLTANQRSRPNGAHSPRAKIKEVAAAQERPRRLGSFRGRGQRLRGSHWTAVHPRPSSATRRTRRSPEPNGRSRTGLRSETVRPLGVAVGVRAPVPAAST